MKNPNRRQFLAVSGAGLAAAGLASVPTTLAQASERPVDPGLIGDEPLLAFVDDVTAGQVTVVHGRSESTITDHDLARKIARLSTSEA